MGMRGLNDFGVYVSRYGSDEDAKKCFWLGYSRFRCGNCRKGYFSVRGQYDHDEACPECKFRVLVRWEGK